MVRAVSVLSLVKWHKKINDSLKRLAPSSRCNAGTGASYTKKKKERKKAGDIYLSL